MSSTSREVTANVGTNSASRIAFALGSSVYSVSTSSVSEIIHPLPLTRIPSCPPTVEGVAALRGDLVALLNIGLVVDLPQLSQDTQRSKWIVLSHSPGSTQFAFAVDKMVEIMVEEPPVDGGHSSDRTSESKARPDIPVLDIDSIIAQIESSLD